MLLSAITFCIITFVFLLFLIVIRKERLRGQRFFLKEVRARLDIKVDNIEKKTIVNLEHFVKYILQLHWYYSIHSILKAILRLIVVFYSYFEKTFEWNRAKAKQLRAEKRQLGTLNHLQQMAEHKESTTLSSAQKKKLRHTKLEERH